MVRINKTHFTVLNHDAPEMRLILLWINFILQVRYHNKISRKICGSQKTKKT